MGGSLFGKQKKLGSKPVQEVFIYLVTAPCKVREKSSEKYHQFLSHTPQPVQAGCCPRLDQNTF